MLVSDFKMNYTLKNIQRYFCGMHGVYLTMMHRKKLIPHSGKFSRTINFVAFEDFTATLKINSAKSHHSTDCFYNLVDPQK